MVDGSSYLTNQELEQLKVSIYLLKLKAQEI